MARPQAPNPHELNASGEYSALERALDHRFSRRSLLEKALSHRSMGGNNNERLEFLGDGILGGLVADLLFRAFPQCPEGALTRHRATLVRKETLAELARSLSLGEYIRLGPGELKSGGFRRDSILANAYEAVIGAIYLDGGYAAARQFIESQYQDRIAALDTQADNRDPKTRLQEFLQKRGVALPRYQVVDTYGADHDRTFVVCCHIDGYEDGFEAKGKSRKIAEQCSAEVAFLALSAAGGGTPAARSLPRDSTDD